ncbi:hypothetical protein OH799_21275 [Nocardia sp. NBC_00881]|uniref:hypothetical protein n=1 Tax=Nocardia sp. NBC_00881 TaxID=2975995 RepID=UPI00386FD7D5|nr:hypothetical protein OH799_21275 [Nocardia sp. NBC_00881]
MSKKVLTMATVAIGAALAPTGVAHAEPNGDPARFADFTAEFVAATDPAAINAKAAGKLLIASPYGTSHTIACRGTDTADIYDCMQEDDLGWITLQKTETPLGTTWIYFP